MNDQRCFDGQDAEENAEIKIDKQTAVSVIMVIVEPSQLSTPGTATAAFAETEYLISPRVLR